MSAHSVRADGSAVSRVDRALYVIEKTLTILAGVVALGVMLLAVANILGRKLGEYADDLGWDAVADWLGPVPGYIDWTEQAVPAIAILGLAATQRDGGHIRMDILVGKLKGRALWLFEIAGVLLMLGVTLALIYGSWDYAMRSWRIGDSSVDIGLVTWPAKMLFPLMFVLLAVRLVVQLWAYLRAFASGDAEPPAVPLPEDAATQALNEANTVSGAAVDETPAPADLASGERFEDGRRP